MCDKYLRFTILKVQIKWKYRLKKIKYQQLQLKQKTHQYKINKHEINNLKNNMIRKLLEHKLRLVGNACTGNTHLHWKKIT